MDKEIVNILVKESGKSRKTVSRCLVVLGISEKSRIKGDLKNLINIYLKIEGPNQSELRQSLKGQITKLYEPINTVNFDSEFKNFLLAESRKKDKQLKKKEKQLDNYSSAVVRLSDKLVGLVDDISMLRVQDSSTIQRLHDKGVLADLLNDLDVGSPAHNAIQLLLKKINS